MIISACEKTQPYKLLLARIKILQAVQPFAGLKMLPIGNYAGTSIRLLLKFLSNLLKNRPKNLFWISMQRTTRFMEIRSVSFFMDIMTVTVFCLCTCSAASISWQGIFVRATLILLTVHG